MAAEQVTYNGPDGATMGQSATEKIGFYGSAVVQYPDVGAPSTYTVSTSGGVFGLSSATHVTAMVAQLSSVVAALKACGLVA